MIYFVATIERMSEEELARLFRDNVWKLHGLLESIVLDRELQFAAELTKELNRMLGIETRLSTTFYPQTDGQTERMNQELEQYLRFFVDYRQKDWPEWLTLAEFVVNNKAHTATKILPFIVNYKRELRIGDDIKKRGKVEKAMEFVERMKKMHEEVGVALKKVQEYIKRQVDKERKETEDWKKEDRILLSTKDLVFKEKPVRKLVNQYIGPYTIEKVISTNTVKLRLPTLMRIHPVVNVSQIVRYKK